MRGMGITVKMIPVPRQISSNCGISIRFDCADIEHVREAIESLQEDFEGFFRQDERGNFHKF